jgi:hypothetical protein
MLELAYPCNPSYPISQRFGENPELYARFGLAGQNTGRISAARMA